MSVIRANERLQHQDLDGAFAALLDAWRASRDPRIADVIDVMSPRVASAEPIPGKSVNDRDDAWRAIAKQQRAKDLPRLLAALWPKQWRNARPLLDLLDRWPDDPRLAAMLVRTAIDPPYTSSASQAFFALVYEKLGKLGDRRGLATLAKLPAARDAVARIEKRAVVAVDEAALANVRAYFAGEIAAASADADRGSKLLAAIYESPDDDAPRAVFADWLVERGDTKRGEFIALQLARGAGEPTKRERELLKEHGRSWAGELGNAFRSDGLVFDRGFFAGGSLEADTVEPLRDPAARLIRHLACWDTGRMIAAIEHLPNLRSVSTSIATLAVMQVVPLTKLHVDASRPDVDLGETIARFPTVRDLSIHIATEPRWLIGRPFDRLEVLGSGATRAIANALQVRELRLLRSSWLATIVDRRCRITLPKAYYNVIGDLADQLENLPDDLVRIEIDPGEVALDETARARLEGPLQRFEAIELAIPWSSKQDVVEDAPVLEIMMYGRSLLDPEHLEPLLALLAEQGQQYDAFVVGRGRAVQDLGADPLARLATWAAKSDRLTIRHKTRRDSVELNTQREAYKGYMASSHLVRIQLVARNGLESIPGWFARLADFAGCDWSTCNLTNPAWRHAPLVTIDNTAVRLAWMFVLPSTASVPAGLTVAGRASSRIAIQLAPEPTAVDDELMRSVAAMLSPAGS